MPIDQYSLDRFVHLDGLHGALEALSDPAAAAKLDAYNAWDPGYEPPSVDVVDEVADGPHGPIPVRIYRPVGEATVPRDPRRGLVWLHGGGWLAGDLDMPESDIVARELAHRADAVIVAVDYRLAVNGVSYPVPHDDVVAAFRWVVAHADRLGIRPREVALGGASAGGNLACGAALHLRDDNDAVLPYLLLLAYPAAHLVLPPPSAEHETAMKNVPSVLRFPPDLILTLAANYLGEEVRDASTVPSYAMPVNGELNGLPPTIIINSEYDDLRPSGEILGRRMTEAGGDVVVVLEAGALHGHLNCDPRRPLVNHSLSIFADALGGPRETLHP